MLFLIGGVFCGICDELKTIPNRILYFLFINYKTFRIKLALYLDSFPPKPNTYKLLSMYYYTF